MSQTKTLKPNTIVRMAFICIFIFLFVSVINLQVQMNELRDQRDTLLEQVRDKQDAIDELELRIATPIDDDFIERIARERGFRKPNEIIFKNNIAG
ncbi:MAG: septum formation initiator family protein [Clostridia bacterium]|nr:septum formation initiator family protein [Clostridia bacterium]